MEEREEQAHGDGLDVVALDEVHDVVHVLEAQRLDHPALGVHALADLEAQVAGHEDGGPVLEQVVEARARRAAQLEHVAQAARRDERRARALALEQRVGDDRRRVGEERDVARGDTAARERGGERVQHAAGEVARRRRHLDDARGAAGLVHQDDVGERAADVDADAPAHGRVFRTASNTSSVRATSASVWASET